MIYVLFPYFTKKLSLKKQKYYLQICQDSHVRALKLQNLTIFYIILGPPPPTFEMTTPCLTEECGI